MSAHRIRRMSLTSLLIATVLSFAAPAAAQNYHARLSGELAKHLATAGNSTVLTVFLEGPQAELTRLGLAYGVTVSATGVVRVWRTPLASTPIWTLQ